MYCTECGAFVPDTCKFCTTCGAPMSPQGTDGQTSANGAAPVGDQAPTPSPYAPAPPTF